MNRIGSSLFLIAYLAIGALAQPELEVAERNRLRELLRISALSEFSQQLKAPLPAKEAYQVFLGFGFDFEARNNLARWIEDWNKKQTPRFARLSITEDIKQADIVLAQFIGDETVLDVTTYAQRVDAHVYEKAKAKREYYETIFSYVLLPLKTEPLHLQAIWRNRRQVQRKEKDTASSESGNSAGWKLRGALFNLVKRRK